MEEQKEESRFEVDQKFTPEMRKELLKELAAIALEDDGRYEEENTPVTQPSVQSEIRVEIQHPIQEKLQSDPVSNMGFSVQGDLPGLEMKNLGGLNMGSSTSASRARRAVRGRGRGRGPKQSAVTWELWNGTDDSADDQVYIDETRLEEIRKIASQASKLEAVASQQSKWEVLPDLVGASKRSKTKW